MGAASERSSIFSRLRWWILSFRISVKIMGIGLILAAILACCTLWATGQASSQRMHLWLEQRTISTAQLLSANLEGPMSNGDVAVVQQRIDRTYKDETDVHYIIVSDSDSQIVAQAFDEEFHGRMSGYPFGKSGEIDKVSRLEIGREIIFDVTTPILLGRAGTLQIGISDEIIRTEKEALRILVLVALAFSIGVGILLSALLTRALTRPIQHLKNIAARIRDGDLDARVTVFSADEIGDLASTVNRMAQSLQDKEAARKSLLAKIVDIQEEERKLVARELHDQLGQSLSHTLLKLQNVCEKSGVGNDLCKDIRDDVASHIDEVRNLAWHIRPPVLDDYGLDSALKRYFRDISEHSGIPIEYKCVAQSDSDRLPANIEVLLYRIAQEATTNSIRHAEPTKISVVLLQKESSVNLMIVDDGVGFDAEKVLENLNDVSCLGVLSMKERAALVGGEVEIESRIGKGTEVLVTMPLGGTD